MYFTILTCLTVCNKTLKFITLIENYRIRLNVQILKIRNIFLNLAPSPKICLLTQFKFLRQHLFFTIYSQELRFLENV